MLRLRLISVLAAGSALLGATAVASPASAASEYLWQNLDGGKLFMHAPAEDGASVYLGANNGAATFQSHDCTSWDDKTVCESQLVTNTNYCLDDVAGSLESWTCQSSNKDEEFWWDQSTGQLVSVGNSGNSPEDCLYVPGGLPEDVLNGICNYNPTALNQQWGM